MKKKIRNDFSLSPVASWQKADPILRLTVKTRSSWYLEFWASTGGTKLIDFIWKVAFLPSFSLSRDIKVPMVCTAPDLTSGTQCCEKSDQVKKMWKLREQLTVWKVFQLESQTALLNRDITKEQTCRKT